MKSFNQKLKRVFKHRPAVAAFLSGFIGCYIAVMVGLTVSQFMLGDALMGALAGLAVLAGPLWGWAEYRARTAYFQGRMDAALEIEHVVDLVQLRHIVPTTKEAADGQ